MGTLDVDWPAIWGEAAPLAKGFPTRDALRDQLYWRLYAGAVPLAAEAGRALPIDRDPARVAALREVAAPHVTWEGGWQVAERTATHVFIQSPALTLYIRDPRRLHPPDAPEGAPVALCLPCGREGLSPGFFTVLGPAGAGSGRLRLYANVAPEAAAVWLGELMARLGGRLPYMAKVATTPAGAARADAAVVYVDEDAYPLARAVLTEIAATHAGSLRPATPLFTLALAPGLAAAESPPAETGESFGQHRCGLVAEATLEAVGAPYATWLAAVERRFALAGTSLAAPFAATLAAYLLS